MQINLQFPGGTTWSRNSIIEWAVNHWPIVKTHLRRCAWPLVQTLHHLPSACQMGDDVHLDRGNESRDKELTVWKVNSRDGDDVLSVFAEEIQWHFERWCCCFRFFSSCLYVEMGMCDNKYILRPYLISFPRRNGGAPCYAVQFQHHDLFEGKWKNGASL